MSIDDGMGGCCRVCGTYHLDTESTICAECLVEAIAKASKTTSVKEALRLIKNELLQDMNVDCLYGSMDSVKAWKKIVSKI